jgi:uncharacterized surface protein with fasciclin (FAS1) repeats
MIRFNAKSLAAAALLGMSAVAAQATGSATVLDVAKEKGNFNTLAKAIEVAGLQDALSGNGPVTIFAPTDEAFAKLGKATIDDLLKPENKDKLKGILLYHVVSGKVMSADIKTTLSPATLQGATIKVVPSAAGVTVNNAKVIKADVGASNGVIHVIDTVILPPAK